MVAIVAKSRRKEVDMRAIVAGLLCKEVDVGANVAEI